MIPREATDQFQAQGGTCRYCGCTRENPCTLVGGLGDRCYWIDKRRTICSSPSCAEVYRALQADTLCALIDRKCLCGGVKSRRQMLCPTCWNLLPWVMSGLLFEPISLGLNCYYAEAAAYLTAIRAESAK
jgi:hypothetical protein